MHTPPQREDANRDVRVAALLASLAIVGGALLYWGLQIQAVREMLALAYGG